MPSVWTGFKLETGQMVVRKICSRLEKHVGKMKGMHWFCSANEATSSDFFVFKTTTQRIVIKKRFQALEKQNSPELPLG
eukprot:SAG11_NODE_25260_length_361_cov_0.980916_1_plen_78_part_01